MEIIIPPKKEITYVGFMTTELGESVIGTDGDVFYYGPFLSPDLSYLEDYYIDPASTKDEFARLHEVEIYQKDLVEECRRILAEYNERSEITNGEYIMTWKSYAPIGELKFNMTNQVNELKDYIGQHDR